MLLMWQALGVAFMGQSQPLVKRRRPSRARARAEISTFLLRPGGLPREGDGFSCLAGLALALQRLHRHHRVACIAGRCGRCWACIDEATGRTTREWCSACVVRLDPCSSSDVPTRTPSQSWGKRNSGLSKVGFLCCIPNAWALFGTIGRLSPLALHVRGEPKAALASPVVLASSCVVVVRERRLGFSDAVNTAGMGCSSPPICPKQCSLRMTAALALDPTAPARAGRAHATPASLRNATWLILPVVICLSQRLSHACVSMNKFRL